jgi:hypothetical protein
MMSFSMPAPGGYLRINQGSLRVLLSEEERANLQPDDFPQ